MKKILSLILTVCLLAACLPLTASAAVESYDLYVGGVEVTAANASDVTGSNITGKVSYDPLKSTLTLENAAVKGNLEDGICSGAAILANKNLTIKTVGTNTLTAGTFESNSAAVIGLGSLTFEGTGTLNVVVPDVYTNQVIVGVSTGTGAITFKSGTVNINMSDAIAMSFAVHSGGGVTVSGGTLVAAGGTTSQTYGIYSEKNGIKVTDGTVTAYTGDFGLKGYGLYCENSGKLVISGGTVTAYSPMRASNCAPDVSSYPGELIEASESESGTPLVDPYLAINISDYKYIKVSRAPIAFEEVEITGIDKPAAGKALDKDVTVPDGVEVVSVSWTPDDDKAKEKTSYKITVSLKTTGTNTFAEGVKVNFNGEEGTVTSATSGSVTATFTFPETGEETETAFTDVPATEYYAKAVAWAVKNGITSGISETKFGPTNTCTRAQAVAFLWRTAGKPEPTITDNPFKDVKPSDYYYKAVLWAKEKNITSGTTPTTFSPNKTCKRSDIVAFLWRAKGRPEPTITENPFKDVKSSDYFYKPVLWAKEKGVTSGVTETQFGPDQSCQRGQIVSFQWRAEGKPE